MSFHIYSREFLLSEGILGHEHQCGQSWHIPRHHEDMVFLKLERLEWLEPAVFQVKVGRPCSFSSCRGLPSWSVGNHVRLERARTDPTTADSRKKM